MKISEALRIIGGSKKASHLKNLLTAYWNLKFEPEMMSSGPVMIQVEPTTYCNLECVMCFNPLSGRKKKHMRFLEFKKLIDSMPYLKKISLVGAGEPLANPELFEMIAYAKSRGILIGLATNAMFLNELNSQKIIESGADWLNISIDSADKEKYEWIRKGAKFDLLVKNVKNFMAMKAKRVLPDVSVWFVMMDENIEDLPNVIKLSKILGVDKVSAQLEHNWSNNEIKNRIADRRLELFYARVKTILKKSKEIAVKSGVHFSFVNVPDSKSPRACKWPWKSCYITVEGFVTPCCLQGSDPGIISFGNIFSENFAAIWNSKAYQDFRKALRSKTLPSICIDCTAYPKMMKL